MSQFNWIPIVILFFALCMYSVYYNVFYGSNSLFPSDKIATSSRINGMPSKLDVCVALRDRLLNVQKVGFVPPDSPVHRYWDQLQCLGMHLPPPKILTTEDVNELSKQDLKLDIESEKPIVDEEEVIKPRMLGQIAKMNAGTSDAVAACQRMQKKYMVVTGESWGSLPERLQFQWKRLECDRAEYETGSLTSPAASPDSTDNGKDIPRLKDIKNDMREDLKKTLVEKSRIGEAKFCREMKTKHDVVPGKSWGTMEAEDQVEWSKLKCDTLFSQVDIQKEEEELTKQLEGKARKRMKGKKKPKKETYGDKDWCVEMKKTYKVIPMQSWGHLPMNMMDTWKSKHCDVVFTKLRMEKSVMSKCTPTDKKTKEPLIAILAGTTSRKMDNPKIEKMSLFTYLFPSLIRSLDCGFKYMFVLGYDKGDKFYDHDEVGLCELYHYCLNQWSILYIGKGSC